MWGRRSSAACFAIGGWMDEGDFEGSLVLEQLARMGLLEEFFDAIDDDDLPRAKALMQDAGVDAVTIKIVLKKMAEEDGEH
jgi:hypothetical protein